MSGSMPVTLRQVMRSFSRQAGSRLSIGSPCASSSERFAITTEKKSETQGSWYLSNSAFVGWLPATRPIMAS